MRPEPSASPELELLELLRSEIVGVQAIAATSGLIEPVAACPGWTVRDLVVHLGGVHRWAAAIVRSGRPQPELEPARPSDLGAWFTEGADALLSTLAAADATSPCWSFTTDKTVGFWMRRQALETLVHRWDAQDALGRPDRLDPGLATLGVSEVVELLVPRQVRLGRRPPLTDGVDLVASDTSTSWCLGTTPAACVSASAAALLLLLWRRIGLDDPQVTVTGDQRIARDVLTSALVP